MKNKKKQRQCNCSYLQNSRYKRFSGREKNVKNVRIRDLFPRSTSSYIYDPLVDASNGTKYFRSSSSKTLESIYTSLRHSDRTAPVEEVGGVHQRYHSTL